MIIGFSRHGTGGGRDVVSYMTDAKREGREEHSPQVLRGDPQNTQRLIDSLDFKHKYTSGVLSFAPEDHITEEMEQHIMDRFVASRLGIGQGHIATYLTILFGYDLAKWLRPLDPILFLKNQSMRRQDIFWMTAI